MGMASGGPVVCNWCYTEIPSHAVTPGENWCGVCSVPHIEKALKAERERCERAVRELCPNPLPDGPRSSEDLGYTHAIMDACATIRELEDE